MTIKELIAELKNMVKTEGLTGNEEFEILNENGDTVYGPILVPMDENGDSFGDLGVDMF